MERSMPLSTLGSRRALRGSQSPCYAESAKAIPCPVSLENPVPALSSLVSPVPRLQPTEGEAWLSAPVFHGSTPNLGFLSCHVSTLTGGTRPHPPHHHDDEEILLLLSGEAELELPELELPESGDRASQGPPTLQTGEAIYYPASFPHTLVARGDRPATYLMFKWHGDPVGGDDAMPMTRFSLESPAASPGGETQGFRARGFQVEPVFEGATGQLRKLRFHLSSLSPGAGYAPHRDPHDVAILVLEGEVQTLGRRVGASSVVFYPGGSLHGMKNPGSSEARYAVFEFHGSRPGLRTRLLGSRELVRVELSRRPRLKRVLRRVLFPFRKAARP
jgi:quercetin dioxygenase-like cupin family protein